MKNIPHSHHDSHSPLALQLYILPLGDSHPAPDHDSHESVTAAVTKMREYLCYQFRIPTVGHLRVSRDTLLTDELHLLA